MYTVTATQKNLGQRQQVDKLEITYEVTSHGFTKKRIPNFYLPIWPIDN